MSLFDDAHLFEQDGTLIGVDGSSGVPGSAQISNHWAHDVDGAAYLHDLGTDPVPAGAWFHGGLAFHTDGCLYVTSESVDVTDRYHGALRVQNDGALRVTTDAVEATDRTNGGWSIRNTGESRVSASAGLGAFVLDELGWPILEEDGEFILVES